MKVTKLIISQVKVTMLLQRWIETYGKTNPKIQREGSKFFK